MKGKQRNKMKLISNILIILVLFLTSLSAKAAEGEKINATGIVLEHVKDSHEWHITGEGDRAVVIHLPVIVYSSTGWHIFSSAQFAEEADSQGMRQGPYKTSHRHLYHQNRRKPIHRCVCADLHHHIHLTLVPHAQSHRPGSCRIQRTDGDAGDVHTRRHHKTQCRQRL